MSAVRHVAGYCGFCAVHCPVVTTVRDGRPVAIEADRTHPFGGAICAKGPAAIEFHDHPDRVNFPLRRTRPKTDPDPGWERIGWDQALDLVAERLLAIRAESGPQAVAFTKGTIGGTALTDTERWFNRLQHHFGTPNYVGTTHLCQWPRDTGGARYTFGTPRLPMPDVERSGAVLLWGSNPTANFLSLGAAIAASRARGARLVVVDPRRIGLANKADVLLQVRPGTDGALALALIHVLIEERRYDEEFVRAWTNAPLLVRDDTGALVMAALDAETGEAVAYDAGTGLYAAPPDRLALRGRYTIRLGDGTRVGCRPVFERLATLAASFPPAVAAGITGAPAERIVAAARLLTDHRPVSHYFHNGLVQHTNATQAARAIEILYALTGDFDRPGGNVVGPGPSVNEVVDRHVLGPAAEASRLGRRDRPIGPPAVPGVAAAYDLYAAILDGEPYPVRTLVALGANMLLANGDTLRGRTAFERLEFFVQVELVHTPTSRFADVLLPAASWLESSALKVGHSFPHAAQARVQLRPPATEPLYERRSDVRIVFDLASRLGLGDAFWHGDVEAGYDHLLAPSGLTVETLRALPHGTSVPTQRIGYRTYATIDPATGAPRGFSTPTRKVELYGTRFADQGLPPLPEYVEPALSPVSTPDLALRYPLVLTNAKRPQYLHSQHRGLASLRKTAANPTAEVHPDTARRYGIADGEWVVVETPSGRVRAQARVTDAILPGLVCCTHGWWEPCQELGLPGFDPFGADGANQNLLVLNDRRDPVSGGTPHRSTLCRLARLV